MEHIHLYHHTDEWLAIEEDGEAELHIGARCGCGACLTVEQVEERLLHYENRHFNYAQVRRNVQALIELLTHYQETMW